MKKFFICKLCLLLIVGFSVIAQAEETDSDLNSQSDSADCKRGSIAYIEGDFRTAESIWNPLANQGDPCAEYGLGMLYAEGQGVAVDYELAMYWFERSAKQKYAKAMEYIGILYADGLGVKKNSKVASDWYKRSAELGGSLGQLLLGSMYERGLGVSQNNILAHMWFNLSRTYEDRDDFLPLMRVERSMTKSEIQKAEQLARECVAKNYKGC